MKSSSVADPGSIRGGASKFPDLSCASVDPEDEEVLSSFQVDSNQFDSGSFASRCSVHLIHEAVSKFDEQKRDIVKSIGFEGILYFPAIKQFNRRFALWLMSCVHAETSSLHIGQHISLRFNKLDVGHVFGIPSSGKRII